MANFLEDCQTSFKFLGYCWYDPNKRLPQDRYAVINNWIVKLLALYLICICIQFFFDMRNPRNERMFVIISFVAYVEIYGSETAFTRQISKITNFFNDFKALVNQRCCGNNDAIELYSDAEKKTSTIKNYVIYLTLIPYNLMLLFSFIFTVIVRIMLENSESDPATWYMLIKMSWPLDRHTVKAYYVYFVLNVLYVNFYFAINGVPIQFFIGSYYYLSAFCGDMKQSLQRIDTSASLSTDKIELDKEFATIVRFHSDIINYYNRLADILSGYLFSYIGGGALLLASCLQQIDSDGSHIDIDFIAHVSILLVALSITYPFCHLSTNAFENMASINANTYDINWFKLPVKYQLYIKLMLIPSQYTHELSGYGFIICSLETFRKMVRLAGSVFLLIKTT